MHPQLYIYYPSVFNYYLFTLSTARRMSTSCTLAVVARRPMTPVRRSSVIPEHDLSAKSKAFFSSSMASVRWMGWPLLL